MTAATISAFLSPGVGSPVLLIHGNSSCKEIWTHQIRFLGRHGRAVLALDLPGHGASSNARTPETTYSFPGYAAVIDELLERLGWRSVDVVGWSLGGHIGLELYATNDKIRSLAIVGTPPVRPSPEVLDRAFHSSESMGLAGKKEFFEADALQYATQMLGGEGCLTRHLFDCVVRTDGNARHFMIKNAKAGVGVDQRHLAETLDKPLCVLHGEVEPFVRLDYLRSLKYRSLWANRIHVLSSVGHAPHWQCPEAFNGVLSSFLELGSRRQTNRPTHSLPLASLRAAAS